jgi:sec-independent protein translocase protein TatA
MAYLPSNFLFIEMPGGGELLVILVVVLLLFGGKKIPELMRGLGKGIREFNDAKSNVTKELEEGMKETPRSNTNAPVNTTTTTTTPSNNSTIIP